MNGRLLFSFATTLLLAACAGFSAPQPIQQSIYVLEAPSAVKVSTAKRGLTLAVSTPQAWPGFETVQMAYVQKAFELNYFATSRWADEPAQMLEHLLMQALEQSGVFRSVVSATDPITADIRLETELVRLQQDFTTQPSRVQITLRAQITDIKNKRVIAVKQFNETEVSVSENAYGGVMAANRALQRLLNQIADFCAVESDPH